MGIDRTCIELCKYILVDSMEIGYYNLLAHMVREIGVKNYIKFYIWTNIDIRLSSKLEMNLSMENKWLRFGM